MAAGRGLPFGLGADDADRLDRLCLCLDRLAALRGEVTARIFSLEGLGDTKALEDLRGRLRRVLEEVHPAAGEYDDPDELLADLGLVPNPQHVYVSGPVAVEHEGAVLDLGRFVPDVGLPAAMIPALRVARLEAALRDAPEYAPFHGVIEEMLRLRRRVEQEAVPPPP